jgi:hypothetical protein
MHLGSGWRDEVTVERVLQWSVHMLQTNFLPFCNHNIEFDFIFAIVSCSERQN